MKKSENRSILYSMAYNKLIKDIFRGIPEEIKELKYYDNLAVVKEIKLRSLVETFLNNLNKVDEELLEEVDNVIQDIIDTEQHIKDELSEINELDFFPEDFHALILTMVARTCDHYEENHLISTDIVSVEEARRIDRSILIRNNYGIETEMTEVIDDLTLNKFNMM